MLVYQPIMDMALGKMVSLEALCRLSQPHFSHSPPNKIIEIAEKNGHMPRLGYDIFSLAFKQLREWQECSYLQNIALSINLSPYQCLEEEFITELKYTCRLLPNRPVPH